MAAATQPIDTPERFGSTVNHPVAAATIIYAGVIVALSATGFAVPAANTAGLKVVGRAEQTVDNSDGADGDLSVNAKLAVFRYNNSETSAIAAADVGKLAYVEDDNTVALTATNKVKAGRIIAVDDDGVWVDQRLLSAVPSVLALTSTDGTAAGAADLAALKVEAEKIGDDVRAVHAVLVAQGLIK